MTYHYYLAEEVSSPSTSSDSRLQKHQEENRKIMAMYQRETRMILESDLDQTNDASLSQEVDFVDAADPAEGGKTGKRRDFECLGERKE